MDSYVIKNNSASINGSKGQYDKKDVKNSASRYGMNAASNYESYIKDFDYKLPNALEKDMADLSSKKPEEKAKIIESYTSELANQKNPPVDFKVRYSPKRLFGFIGAKINKLALMGSAYHELGNKTSMSTDDMTQMLQKTYNLSQTSAKADASSLDLNNDGKIDLAEEASSIVLSDILSKDKTQQSGKIKIKNADGTYTNNGENELLAFANANNKEAAKAIFNGIYQDLKLDKAQEKFIKKNNL